MKFRKKPVVIEAMQFTEETKNQVFNWISCTREVSWDALNQQAFLIRTLEGDMLAIFGDWIIKGIKGEFHPCKPDIFDATYEPVLEGRAMNIDWQIGPAKLRSDKYEARILMLDGSGNYPIIGVWRACGDECWIAGAWTLKGERYAGSENSIDLLPPEPPKLSRDDAIRAAWIAAGQTSPFSFASGPNELLLSWCVAFIDHYDKLRGGALR